MAAAMAAATSAADVDSSPDTAEMQGLTLVHFSAQRKRILWNRVAFRVFLGGVHEVSGGIKEHWGVFRVHFVSETAQVELRSGRV